MATMFNIKLSIATIITSKACLPWSLKETSSNMYYIERSWGAYAIPLALSVVRRPSSVVRRVSSVSTITTRNN